MESKKLQFLSRLRNLEILLGFYPSGKLKISDQLPKKLPPIPSGLPSDLLTRRPDLKAALDDSEDRPMITHNTDKTMRVFLQLRNTYKYSDRLAEKRTRIKNLQADLKASEEKAVRENKAEIIKTDYSVVFKG